MLSTYFIPETSFSVKPSGDHLFVSYRLFLFCLFYLDLLKICCLHIIFLFDLPTSITDVSVLGKYCQRVHICKRVHITNGNILPKGTLPRVHLPQVRVANWNPLARKPIGFQVFLHSMSTRSPHGRGQGSQHIPTLIPTQTATIFTGTTLRPLITPYVRTTQPNGEDSIATTPSTTSRVQFNPIARTAPNHHSSSGSSTNSSRSPGMMISEFPVEAFEA